MSEPDSQGIVEPDDQHGAAEPEDRAIAPAGGWSYAVAAGVPLAFGVIMLTESLALGLGTLAAPEPGLWPFMLSVTLVCLSLLLLIGWSRFGQCEAWGTGAVRVGIGATSIAAFIVLLPRVGLEFPAIALLAFWIKVLGGETWRLSLLASVGAVTALHLLFVELLDVPIPHLFGI